MKKLFFLLFIVINFSFGLENITYHRTNFSFLAPPQEDAEFLDIYLDSSKRSLFSKKRIYWDDLNPNKNKFLFMYFMDIYCPFTVKNIPQLQQVLAYIRYYYPNLVKPVLIEALPRNWLLIKNFVHKAGLSGIPYYMSPDMNINEYLHVESTPTVLIMDPEGNIVDKIEGNKLAPIYITHLDYIIGHYLLANGITDLNGLDVRDLASINPEKTLERIRDALVDAGIIKDNQKLNYSNDILNPLTNDSNKNNF